MHTNAKSVQFDLNPQEQSPERTKSPDRSRSHRSSRDGRDERDYDLEDHRRGDDRESRDRGRRGNGEMNGTRNNSNQDDTQERKRHRDDSPDSVSSDATIELPPRFDEYGRRKADDPLAEKLESVLQGLFR